MSTQCLSLAFDLVKECSGRQEREFAAQELDLEEVEEQIAELSSCISEFIQAEEDQLTMMFDTL